MNPIHHVTCRPRSARNLSIPNSDILISDYFLLTMIDFQDARSKNSSIHGNQSQDNFLSRSHYSPIRNLYSSAINFVLEMFIKTDFFLECLFLVFLNHRP